MAPTKPKTKTKSSTKARGGESRERELACNVGPTRGPITGKKRSSEAVDPTAVLPRRLRSSRPEKRATAAGINGSCSVGEVATSGAGGGAKEDTASAAAALVDLSVAGRKCGAVRSASTPQRSRAGSSSSSPSAARASVGPPSSGKRERHGRCADAGGYAALAQGSPARASVSLPGFRMSPVSSPAQSDDVISIMPSTSTRDQTSTRTTRTAPAGVVEGGDSSDPASSSAGPTLSTTTRKGKGKAPAREKYASSSRAAKGKERARRRRRRVPPSQTPSRRLVWIALEDSENSYGNPTAVEYRSSRVCARHVPCIESREMLQFCFSITQSHAAIVVMVAAAKFVLNNMYSYTRTEIYL